MRSVGLDHCLSRSVQLVGSLLSREPCNTSVGRFGVSVLPVLVS